jgi:hypothetical protein
MNQSAAVNGNEGAPSKHLRDDLRLREYEALQDKIAHTRSDVGRAETIYPLAVISIYAWIFTNPPVIRELWMLAMALPVVIALLGIVRLRSRKRGMDLLESYVRNIEIEIYGADCGLGWERKYSEKRPLKWLVRVRAILMGALFVVTLILAWQAPVYFDELQAYRSQHGR